MTKARDGKQEDRNRAPDDVAPEADLSEEDLEGVAGGVGMTPVGGASGKLRRPGSVTVQPTGVTVQPQGTGLRTKK